MGEQSSVDVVSMRITDNAFADLIARDSLTPGRSV